MKRLNLSSACGALLLTVLALGQGPAAIAASYYWDTNGAAAGIGSATSPVAWLTNSWATGSTGTLATGAWPNSQPANADEAVFMGTSGTVTLGSDVYANALRFQTNNYTISSTGGVLNLAGDDPTVTVNLASNNQVVTISAPIAGSAGWTLAGNSLSGGLKFLVLANNSATTPNSFSSPLAIAAGGALRIGGAMDREQIPDDADLVVDGVIDFVTSGGASNMKQEKVRNASVNGAGAIFSVGNGTTFVVNSMTGTNATNISLNGNGDPATFVPGRLVIDGWHDGSGDLTLHTSQLKLNATSATNAIGSRIVLSGDIHSSGASLVNNNNGNASSPTTNTFTHEHVDFAGEMHTIDVADGTLTFSSAAANHPLQITSLAPAGTTLTKTGPGVWLYQNAEQTSFAGTNRVEEGTLRIGASERLADASNLEVAGGTFDVQSFTETVAEARLIGGAITGSGLVATANGFFAEEGTVDVVVGGNGGLHKSTGAVVQLNNANTYLGDTRVAGGTLQMTHASGLPDATDVLISGGALLDLSFAGVDTIAALVLPGVPQTIGLWGATGNLAADFTSDLIAGAGLLNVTSLRGLAGDYNGDNVVDAVDYTVWRNHLGEPDESSLANNGDGLNGVDGGDYALWRMRYGDAQPGAGAGGILQVVPEPTGAALLTLASLLPGAGARWRSQSASGFHLET